MKRASFVITALVLAITAAFAMPAFAAVTVTPASYTGTISADTVGGSYKPLTGPSLVENVVGDVGTGSIRLDAPSGFQFSGTPATVTVTGGGPSQSLKIFDSSACTTPASTASVTPTTSSVTVFVCSTSVLGTKKATIAWSGLSVRPSAGTPLASGNITKSVSSTSTISGVTNGSTNFGTLTEVPGAYSQLTLSPSTSSITAGGSESYSSTQRDQFGNALVPQSGTTTYGISPNGSCVGSSCTATISGGHTVTGTNGALSGAATLTVNAAGLDHLVLAPPASSITAGDSQSYTAEGFDVYGNSKGDVTTGTTFSIAPDGSCVNASCTASVAGGHTVTGDNAGKTGTASLTVDAGALDHLILSPSSSSIVAGGSQSYTAEGYDSSNNSLGDVTATTNFTIDGDACSGTSCSSTVTGPHNVVGTKSGATGSATLTVTPGDLDHIVISPPTQTKVAGEAQLYTAEGFDSFNNSRGVVTSETTFDITGGTCVANSCSSTTAGDHTVTGTNGTASNTATLTVVGGDLDSFVISPSTSTKTAGDSETYSANGFDQFGNDLGDVTAGTTFGIVGGTCVANSCSATSPGDHTVTGTNGSVSDTATLSVTAGPLNSIVISPDTASKTAGDSQDYSANGYDQFGNDLGDVTAGTTFSIAGGTCTANSCSSNSAGDQVVTGTNGSASDTATLTVTPAAFHHIILTPQDATVDAGQSQGYSVEAFDEYGNSRGPVTGDTVITIDGDPCAGSSCSSDVAGNHAVQATYLTGSDGGTLHVNPAALDHITISPKTSVKSAGESQSYTTEGFDQYGNSRGSRTSETTFTIAGGTCTGNSCAATTAGAHTVTATDGTATDTATQTVTAGAPTSIVLSPKTASKAAGVQQAYTATGTDIFGNPLGNVTASTTFTIAGGTCVANSCSANTAGNRTVTGTNGSATDTATLTVVAGPVAQVTLLASATTVNASPSTGNKSTLTARATDSHGNIVAGAPISFSITQRESGLGQATPLSPTVVANRVTTDASGQATATYTAGYAFGNDKVKVTSSPATAEVTIVVQPSPCGSAPSAPICTPPSATMGAPAQHPVPADVPQVAAPEAPARLGDAKL